MEKLRINTEKSYDVIIQKGALNNLGHLCNEVKSPCKICVITDENVSSLYSRIAEESLSSKNFQVYKKVLKPGESSKSMKSLDVILEYLAENQFTRKDLILALGGGVIGDLAGFAAATYLRGIDFIQVPTTLLSMVDSSVGGKTAINLKAGKNLAGSFWQPSLVVVDINSLKTLSKDLVLDGVAEVIKAGVIADKNLFEYMKNSQGIFSETFFETCISNAIRIKASLVEEDEMDLGKRQLLNLGHTIGHAIEKCSDFKISHGHAVAIGMIICSKASWEKNWSTENCYNPIKELLSQYGFPLDLSYSPAQLYEGALMDKKRKGDKITLVIPITIGNCRLKEIEVSSLLDFIKAGME